MNLVNLRCTPRPAELRELVDQFEYPLEQRAAKTESIFATIANKAVNSAKNHRGRIERISNSCQTDFVKNC